MSRPARQRAPALAELKSWYGEQSKKSSLAAGRSQASAEPTPLALQWEKCDTLGNATNPLSWVPIEGSPPQEFTPNHQGYRRLVAGYAGGQVAGVIVEVTHNGPALSLAQIDNVFRQLYNAWQQGQVAQLPGFSGLVAFYSRENYYLTGRIYRQGVASTHPAYLKFVSVADTAANAAGRGASPGAPSLTVECVASFEVEAEANTVLLADYLAVTWVCTISGNGGGPPPSGPPPGNTGGGNTGNNPGPAGSGGGSGGGGNGGSGGPLSDEQYDDGSGNGYGGYNSFTLPAVSPNSVVVTPSIQNNPKAECILTKLLANAQFQQLLKNFQGTSQYNVSFTLGALPPNAGTNSVATTQWNPATSTVEITIKPSPFDYQHAIWGAQSFFHEAYHAQLVQFAIATFGTTNMANWPKPVNNMTLQELIGYVNQTTLTNSSWGTATHQFMAYNNQIMAEGLRSFVQTNYPVTYAQVGTGITKYNYLSLMGLEGTDRFRDEITNQNKQADYLAAIGELSSTELKECYK